MQGEHRHWESLVISSAGLGQAALSHETVEQVCRIIADTVGVMAGGARQKEVRAYLAPSPPLFPATSGPATIFTTDPVAGTPEQAAFVNATAGTFLELDEGLRPTGHPAIHVVPAALAAAETLQVSGDTLVRGVLAGYEVTARLFEAYRLRHPLHPHGHFGALGAAVAVAILLDEDPLPSARVASTFPLLSVWDTCYEGATARNAYTGSAAATGLRAHRLSAAGFRGSRDALDSGFGNLVGGLVDEEALSAPVDPNDLRVHRNYFKFHSTCALSHAAVEAALELRPSDPTDVLEVRVETVSNNLKIARTAEPNDLSTRFSLPYSVAAVLIHGESGPAAFSYDTAVAELAQRVRVEAAADLSARWPDAAPARVTVRSSQGRRTLTVDNPQGHHANPGAPGRLRDKFVSLVERENASRRYERLLELPTSGNVADWLRDVWWSS